MSEKPRLQCPRCGGTALTQTRATYTYARNAEGTEVDAVPIKTVVVLDCPCGMSFTRVMSEESVDETRN